MMKIFYNGIGSNYENEEECVCTPKKFIRIINNNKHLFNYDQQNQYEDIPNLNENNFTEKGLKNLVKFTGAVIQETEENTESDINSQ